MKAQNGDIIGRAYSSLTSVSNCYTAGVTELLKEKFGKNVGEGFVQNSTADAFGALSFYTTFTQGGNSLVRAVSAPVTISDGRLTSATSEATYVASVTIGSEVINYKIFGDGEYAVFSSLFGANGELQHMTLLGVDNEIVTSELFLPVAIKNKGVTIEWQSSNPEMLSNSGDLADEVGNKTPITLFATVRINGKVYTRSFSFVVSSQNNQTRFNSFLAQLGTIDLTSVYDGTNQNSAFVYLPILDPNYSTEGYNGYDYRNAYSSPVDTEAQYHLDWAGYDDINYASIEYVPISTYSYISVDASGVNRAVYLNIPVFSNFAQILVRATFIEDVDENNEPVEYSAFVNINIHPGTYAELLEIVFTDVREKLNAVDIYKNIVDTRKVDGMLNEKGDFVLSTVYKDSEEYAIEYSRSLVNNAVSGVTVNDDNSAVIHVNPAAFSSVESTAYVHVKVMYTSDDTVYAERDLPFTIPAVIKPDDIGFDNYSLFSSVQYQVWDKLPSDEKIAPTGFSIAGNTITNSNAPYILVKDVEKCNITDLKLLLDNDNTAKIGSSEVAYNMVELIRWATGNGTSTVGSLGEAFAGQTVTTNYNLTYGDGRVRLPSGTEITELASENQTASGQYLYKDASEWKYYGFTAGTSNQVSRSITYNCLAFASYSFNTSGTGAQNKFITGTLSGSLFQVATLASGATLNDNNKFVFLSSEDLATVFNFVKGIAAPTAAVGETNLANLTTNTGYYLYCPATGYFLGQTTDNVNDIPYFNIATYTTLTALQTALDNGNAKYRLTLNTGYSNSYAVHSLGTTSGLNLYGGTTGTTIGVWTISGDPGSHWLVSNTGITYTPSNNFTVTTGSVVDGPHTVYGNSGSGDTPFAYVSNDSVTVSFNMAASTATVSGVVGGVSTDLQSVASDGQEYLNPNEVAVLKAYYDSVTNGLSGAVEWDSFWEAITYTPAGRIVTNGNELAKVAKGLTNETLTNDLTPREKYFKYYENYMWATNIKDEVEAGGIYAYPNSGSMTGAGTYVVELSDGTTRTFNFNNSGQDKATFGEDNSIYISAPEEAVLRHFIYSQGGGTSGAATYYTAFLQYTTFPTYMNDGAVNTIIGNIYAALGYTSATTYTEGEGFVASVHSEGGKYYPRISNADGALYALTQFSDLTSFTLSGDINTSGNEETAGIPAFLQTASIKTFFSRLAINQTGLTSLTLRNLAQDYTLFSLEGIEKFTSLTHLDLGCNYGITNIGYILNAKYKLLTYLDVCGCNSLDRYKEFTLLAVYNLADATPTVYYTPDNSRVRTIFNTVKTVPEALTYLHEIDVVDSAYLQLLTTASDGSNIIWDIAEGNDVKSTIATAGNQVFTNKTSVAQMEELLTSYYYCTENCTSGGVNYIANHIYKITYDNSNFALVDTGVTGEVASVIATSIADVSDASLTLLHDTAPITKADPTITTTGTVDEQIFDSAVTAQRYDINQDQIGTTTISIRKMQYMTATLTQTNTWRIRASMKKELLYTNRYYYTGDTLITDNGEIDTDSIVTNIEYTYENITGQYIDITETVTWSNCRIYTKYASTRYGTYSDIPTGTAYVVRSGVNYLVDAAAIDNGLTYYGDGLNNVPTISSAFVYSDVQLGETIDEAFTLVNNNTALSGNTAVFTYNGTSYNFSSGGETSITNGITAFDNYISYAAPISTTEAASGYINGTAERANLFYRYTGATGNATAYYQSATAQTNSYTGNAYYQLTYSTAQNRLVLTNTTNNGLTYSNTNTGTTSMEGLLTTANGVRYTATRGLYYGNYYYYTGDDTTVNGHTYRSGYIYRLVYDVNTGFRFEEKYSCEQQADQDDFINYLYVAVDNTDFEDEYYRLTARSDRWRYGVDFYRLSKDNTGTMMMMTFGALSESVTARMINERIYDPTDYNGTGGEQEAVIAATVIVNGEEFTRLFHVSVIGTQQ